MRRLTLDTLKYAIADAVATLTRCRIRKNGPFYLPRPKAPLNVGYEWGPNLTCLARVRCSTWGDIVVKLTLTNGHKDSDWLAWGDFDISYGKKSNHPSLVNVVLNTKRIRPTCETSDRGLPMRYQIRSRARR